MTTPETNPASGTAVWYFVGATFVFAMPGLLFGDLNWWARIAFIAFGFAIMVAGFFQLRRELRSKRPQGRADDSDSHPRPPEA